MKSKVKNLLVFLVTLLICLVVLEAGTRIFSPQALFDVCTQSHPDWPRPMIISDELLGWKPKANSTWCLHQPDTQKKVTITTNSRSMRTTQEFTYEKPDNTFRVLILGDSFVWAEQVEQDETIHVLLEKEIREKIQKIDPDKNVEIIPFSGGGYGTHQLLLYYLNEGDKYNADLVIYFFYHNDFVDSFNENTEAYPGIRLLIDEESEKIRVLTPRTIINIYKELYNMTDPFPYYMKDENKPMAILSKSWQFLLGNSHFVNFASKAAVRATVAKQQNNETLQNLIFELSPMYPELLESVNMTDEKYLEWIKRTGRAIKVFSKKAKKKNSTFVLVNIPSPYQTHKKYKEILADAVEKAQEKRGKGGGKNPLSTFEGKNREYVLSADGNYYLKNLAKENKFHFVDLTKLAQENKKKFHFKTDNHWTPQGIILSAKAIAAELDKEKLLSTS